MEDSYESYKTVKLQYTSCSTTENHDMSEPPIILIHGLFANSTTWNRVNCKIGNKTRRKVYTIDLRNHGKSEYTDEFSLKHMTADVLQFMKDEKIKLATFIGHSVGGRIVMELALRKPELVENAIVEDIAINDVGHNKINLFETLAKHIYKTVSALPITMSEVDAYRMLNKIVSKYTPQFSRNGERSGIEKALPFYKDERTGEFKFLCNMETIIKSLGTPAVLRNDLTGDPVYNESILFIKGEHTIIPIEEDKETILKYFPKAQFETIKGAFHVSHTECADAFVNVVCEFINSKKKT